MRLSRFFLLSSILCFVVVFALSAGGNQGHPHRVTIKFDGSSHEFPQEFIDSFCQVNPDIEIEKIEPEWTRRVADMMAGTAADLLLIGTGTAVAYFSRRGLILDVTDRLKNSDVIRYEDIDLLGNASYRFNGTDWGSGPWFGLCKDYNNIGCITYNREMFASAGLAPLSESEPITYYDDLFTLAEKLTRKDEQGNTQIWGYDFNQFWVYFLTSDMATAEGLSLYQDEGRSVMNDDPRVRELWKYWLRFPVADISSNIRNIAPAPPYTAFANDRVAMVQQGYWYGASLRDIEGYQNKYGWAPTPILRPGSPRVTNTLGATGLVIYAGSEHPDEAFRVFEYYIGGEIGLHRAKTGWGIPPLLSLRTYLPEDNEFDKSRKRIAFDDAKYFMPWQASPHILGALFFSDWDNSLKDLVEGEIDMDTFVDRMYDAANDSLKRGKEELGM